MNIRPRFFFLVLPIHLLLVMTSSHVLAHGVPPATLTGKKVPVTPGLLTGSNRIIINARYAQMLGKSLFWDASIGSDGMACASCHYHAGADSRTRNQLNPGQKHAASSGAVFDVMASGGAGGVDYQLRLSDFPTYQLSDPNDRLSPPVFASDDVIGSSGTYLGHFQLVHAVGDTQDQCGTVDDSLFALAGKNTRQVTDRNAPTVINAAFNHHNFWDGRANNRFNGETPWGSRDGAAGVWLSNAKGVATKSKLSLENASLASQAVAPATNDVEMSCQQRKFPDIAVKLLQRRALETQAVSRTDSLLGSSMHTSGKGLKLTYEQLIQKAFSKAYWQGKGDFGAAADGKAYSMMQANFAMFFGIAIMEYEKTLISNKTPYDTSLVSYVAEVGDTAGTRMKVPKGLSPAQKRGLTLFLDGHCQNCHGGPTFSNAANPFFNGSQAAGSMLVNRFSLDGSYGPGALNVMTDVGFFNTSVTPTAWDIGLGGVDPWGYSLAYSGLYAKELAKGSVAAVDHAIVYPCEFDAPFYTDWSLDQLMQPVRTYPARKCQGALEYDMIPTTAAWAEQRSQAESYLAADGTAGAFKVPSLRNVELTGPYFHNGSAKSLEEVVDFYSRGGNLVNRNHPNVFVFQQGFSDAEKADLVAFLKSLTDERVRWEKAPFDHPELRIPEGVDVTGGNGIRANVYKDLYFTVPAVGSKGRSPEQGALKTFAEELAP